MTCVSGRMIQESRLAITTFEVINKIIIRNAIDKNLEFQPTPNRLDCLLDTKAHSQSIAHLQLEICPAMCNKCLENRKFF